MKKSFNQSSQSSRRHNDGEDEEEEILCRRASAFLIFLRLGKQVEIESKISVYSAIIYQILINQFKRVLEEKKNKTKQKLNVNVNKKRVKKKSRVCIKISSNDDAILLS